LCWGEEETRVSYAIILAFEGETMEIWDDEFNAMEWKYGRNWVQKKQGIMVM
jgi:hypothetical protein